MSNKIIWGVSIAIICLSILLVVCLYQPINKSMNIYSTALESYQNKDFQNSYYQFSKISFFSPLKPYAIYRQAMCAKALEDKKSELKQYQLLFNNYTNNKLSLRSKYLTAQLIVKEKPKVANKYFDEIIKKYPDTDFAIASEYYKGVVLYDMYKDNQIFPESVKDKIENAYRHYLIKAPQGRLALNTITNWLKLGKHIELDDYLLMANTYYLYDNWENARKFLTYCDLKDSWVLDVKNSYALKNYQRVRDLVQYGLQNYANYTDDNDIKDVIDIYLNISDKKTADINYLFTISQPKGKDYIWSLKCDATIQSNQGECYKQLYLNFPNTNYGASALSNLFFNKIKLHDYANAEKIGKDYLSKFQNNNDSAKVMFWLGKLSEYKKDYASYTSYYKSVINKFPDTYYAYRAYVALKHHKSALLDMDIKEKPVLYPYKNISKNDIIFKLIQLQDYEIIDLISDDEFVKSWLYYEKGDYSLSTVTARDAMNKIYPKPQKDDLRWRLVYPLNYYDEIKKYTDEIALILSLIREESYFNPNAVSPVGARGLMQLMPFTAKSFAEIRENDLYKPELNIRIGTNYYKQIRGTLNNFDILAVAAYNGGIGALNKWKNNLVYDDADTFVEQIPYSETKNYVKKVFCSYWNYLRIYAN